SVSKAEDSKLRQPAHLAKYPAYRAGSSSLANAVVCPSKPQLSTRRIREKSTTKPAKRLGKTRRRSRLGKRFAFPSFPQPRRQSTSGYISNVSTDNPRVTFSNGLTRPSQTRVVSRHHPNHRSMLIQLGRSEEKYRFKAHCLPLAGASEAH